MESCFAQALVFPRCNSAHWQTISEHCKDATTMSIVTQRSMAYFTEDEALEAVKMNGRNLDRVPHEFRSEELCQAAVTQSGSSLEFVPRVWKEEPLCLLAVQKKMHTH